MNIQNIQSISQNVDKTYGMLNELGSNGLELMDLAIPNHDGGLNPCCGGRCSST